VLDAGNQLGRRLNAAQSEMLQSRRVRFASQKAAKRPRRLLSRRVVPASSSQLLFDRSILATPSRPRRGAPSTSQGHPRTIFRRALERGNLVLAEVTAREIGRVTIAEALELTALVARKQPHRYGRFAARWAVPLSRRRQPSRATLSVPPSLLARRRAKGRRVVPMAGLMAKIRKWLRLDKKS
jgi:hypothetical protein